MNRPSIEIDVIRQRLLAGVDPTRKDISGNALLDSSIDSNDASYPELRRLAEEKARPFLEQRDREAHNCLRRRDYDSLLLAIHDGIVTPNIIDDHAREIINHIPTICQRTFSNIQNNTTFVRIVQDNVRIVQDTGDITGLILRMSLNICFLLWSKVTKNRNSYDKLFGNELAQTVVNEPSISNATTQTQESDLERY